MFNELSKEEINMRKENLTLREVIMKQFELCKAITADIIKHKAEEGMLYYARTYAEIESFLTGETDAPWIRINYGDIYIFIDAVRIGAQGNQFKINEGHVI